MNSKLKRFISQYPPHAIEESDIADLAVFDKLIFAEDSFDEQFWRNDILNNPKGTEIIRVNKGPEGIAACVQGVIKTSKDTSQYGEVGSIAIAKEYRGMGLGTYMFDRCIERLLRQHVSYVVMQTHIKNSPMQYMAKQKGFVISRTLTNYYKSGIRDAYEMVLIPAAKPVGS